MSRTHKTKPLWVKMRQGHIQTGVYHDHVKGYCDLPEKVTDSFWRGGGHCHYTYEYTGVGFCCCWMCHGDPWSKTTRARVKRQVDRWDEEYYSPDEEYAYEYEKADRNVEAHQLASDFCEACYGKPV